MSSTTTSMERILICIRISRENLRESTALGRGILLGTRWSTGGFFAGQQIPGTLEIAATPPHCAHPEHADLYCFPGPTPGSPFFIFPLYTMKSLSEAAKNRCSARSNFHKSGLIPDHSDHVAAGRRPSGSRGRPPGAIGFRQKQRNQQLHQGHQFNRDQLADTAVTCCGQTKHSNNRENLALDKSLRSKIRSLKITVFSKKIGGLVKNF